MNENQLIALVQNGEHDAYRPLVERYLPGLVIHCDQFLRDRDAAEDIAQDTCIKAYRAISTYDAGKGAFSTWLYRIASNQARDYLRRHKRKVNIDEIDQIPSEPPALSNAEKREIRAKVSALTPPEYARVVESYYWQGKRYAQIAAEMNVPAGTVATWLKRAKLQLRKELL